MHLFRRLRTSVRILREKDGIHRLLFLLRTKYGLPLPQSAVSKWKGGIPYELDYWDHFLRIGGFDYRDTFADRIDPESSLQSRPAELIAGVTGKAKILDVGAGPLTYLGKKRNGESVEIVAVDPLADSYNDLLDKYGVTAPVRTSALAAESLSERFSPDSFDLVFARNCIDHSFDPEQAILQMIRVVKQGRHVLLEHTPNEADRQGFHGLHQWNFSVSESGDFVIRSKTGTFNFTQRHRELCEVKCEILVEENEEWLVTRIWKRPKDQI